MPFDAALTETVRTFQSLSDIRREIDAAAQQILSTLQSGHTLLIGGNGGSAAEASHFATELTGRYCKNRRPLPAIALGADASLLSCVGNDFGFDQVFARQIRALGRPGDLVVLLSSSGNSANIIAALEEARRLGVASIALLGREGGRARGIANVDVIVPGSSGRSAQEAHLFLIHHFCDLIDQAFD